VAAPSITDSVASCALFAVCPLPIRSPNERFLPVGEMHVVTRSPSPARPANVSAFAPLAIPSRDISARLNSVYDTCGNSNNILTRCCKFHTK
jgi:hypothetical protein